jgi:hypothetical protein
MPKFDYESGAYRLFVFIFRDYLRSFITLKYFLLSYYKSTVILVYYNTIFYLGF